MKLEIKKTVTENLEIHLDKPVYVCFCGWNYYRFTEVEEIIKVLYFSAKDAKFELQSRDIYDHEFDILSLDRKYAEPTTEDEFDSKLQELLLNYI